MTHVPAKVSEKKGICKSIRQRFPYIANSPIRMMPSCRHLCSLHLEEGVSDTTAKENEVLGFVMSGLLRKGNKYEREGK